MVFAKCFSLVKKFEARLHDIFYSWTFDLLLINSRYSVWSFRSNRSELNRIYSLWSFRSSRPEKQSPEVFCTKGALRNFAKFTEKHLCQSLFFDEVADLRPVTLLKKRLWHRCFPVDFAKFLRTPFFTEHLQWLLLKFISHHTKEILYVQNTNFLGNQPFKNQQAKPNIFSCFI